MMKYIYLHKYFGICSSCKKGNYNQHHTPITSLKDHECKDFFGGGLFCFTLYSNWTAFPFVHLVHQRYYLVNFSKHNEIMCEISIYKCWRPWTINCQINILKQILNVKKEEMKQR